MLSGNSNLGIRIVCRASGVLSLRTSVFSEKSNALDTVGFVVLGIDSGVTVMGCAGIFSTSGVFDSAGNAKVSFLANCVLIASEISSIMDVGSFTVVSLRPGIIRWTNIVPPKGVLSGDLVEAL